MNALFKNYSMLFMKELNLIRIFRFAIYQTEHNNLKKFIFIF
jgi:hypothetical protein